MAIRGKDEQKAAKNLKKDVGNLVEFDQNLQEALPKLEEMVQTAEKADKQMDEDLHELENQNRLDRVLRDIARGKSVDKEELQFLKDALGDIQEIHQALQELEKDFEIMTGELKDLEQSARKAAKIDEDADEDIELILNMESN